MFTSDISLYHPSPKQAHVQLPNSTVNAQKRRTDNKIRKQFAVKNTQKKEISSKYEYPEAPELLILND